MVGDALAGGYPRSDIGFSASALFCNDGPTPMEIDDEEEKLEEKAKEVEEYSDSFHCIIYLNPWKREGPHQTCCLSCGHLYGLSCIQNCINLAAKCPQCNVRCNLNEVIKLFVLPAILLDQNLHKENKKLKDENCVLMSRIPSTCLAFGSGQSCLTSPCQGFW
ncbi:hypothetical protein Pint_35158 [Pistacia integerrima]|uniref:Uncharacterized protein n=1 Tax=Pistacia integerrima TaxID=434235 RepID=A0ACC0Y2M0_9ROSI|nr:hypothetical protein Pint_35158 [Pistacia integerrima]